MLGIVLICNMILLLFLAVIWSKDGVFNFLLKFVLWIGFIVDLLITLNYYGVLLFGKIPLI